MWLCPFAFLRSSGPPGGGILIGNSHVFVDNFRCFFIFVVLTRLHVLKPCGFSGLIIFVLVVLLGCVQHGVASCQNDAQRDARVYGDGHAGGEQPGAKLCFALPKPWQPDGHADM